jgi:drug/metabolite transporter (DMT)-like permease
MAEPSASRGRARILSTSHGANPLAFTTGDWTRFLSIALIWGSSFLLIAESLESFEPGLITWLRVSLGAAVLWLFRGAHAPIARPDVPRVFVVSVLWVAIPFTLFPLAQQHVSSAVAGMLNGGVPLVATVIGALMLRALPGRAQLVGLALGFAGIVMISVPEFGDDTSSGLGVAMIFAAVLCYGIAIVIVTPVHQRYGALPVTARMLAIAAVLTAPFGIASIPGSSFSWAAFTATTVLGAVGTGLAFVIMGSLVASVGSMRGSFATYLIPVVATILGIAVRDEDVALAAIVGVAFVIAGAILAARRDRARPQVEVVETRGG